MVLLEQEGLGDYMNLGALGSLLGGGILGTAINGSNAAADAAKIQSNAANKATQLQQDQFNVTNENQKPYREAGYTALNDLTKGTAEGGYFSHQFDANDLKNNLAPNYDFMLKQGEGQVANQFSTSGGKLSGNEMQGLNEFTQNYAGNAFQNAFNNYTTNQSNIYNRLANIANLGQESTQSTANTGANAVNNEGNYLTSGAAAQAAGKVGQANALTGGVNNIIGLASFLG